MKVRYMRNMDGAEKMFQDGYCWVDCVLWSHDGFTPPLRTFEDVGRQTKCGYCARCMTVEEYVAYWAERGQDMSHLLGETAK